MISDITDGATGRKILDRDLNAFQMNLRLVYVE